MLRNLLEKLNRIWYNKSRVSSILMLKKGTGTHQYVTIEGGTLYFHSLPFSYQLTSVQTVLLDDMTVNDMIDVVRRMGYEVEVLVGVSSLDESALTLLEVKDRRLENGETLYGFTANIWRVMYPLHRKLVEAGRDVDEAVTQIMLPSAKGEWLDYWAGFLKAKRLPDESDELFFRRISLTMASVKGNNVAIEELISYYINANVSVLDYLPGIFEIRVTPSYMDSVQKIRDLVKALKGAGVSYILNYAIQYSESYPVAFKSSNGQSFKDLNASFKSVGVDFGRLTENYSFIPPERVTLGFQLNRSRLNSQQILSVSDKRIIEKVSMVMTQNGSIIKQM